MRVMWFNRSSAYPIWIQDELTVNGAKAHVLLSLEAVAPGSAVIPFKPPATMEADAPPVPSGTAGEKAFPAQGAVRHPCLRMEDALQLVETHPRHAPFRVWRAARPEALMVGIFSGCLGNFGNCPDRRLEFTFATPLGEAYGVVVRDENGSGDPDCALEQQGPMRSQRFDPAPLSGRFSTIADAYAKWLTFTENHDLPPEFTTVEWGFWFGNSPTHAWGSPKDWDSIRVYRWLPDVGTAVHFDVDARTGLILTSSDTRYATYHVSPLGGGPLVSTRPQPASLDARGGATAAGPEDLVSAGLVSGGLIALWLTAYFFPILKYAGTQALSAVAGYAKLRKEHVLDHRLRDELLSLIRADPGASATQLSRGVSAGWSTIVYHLGVLQRNRLVTSFLDTRHRRFFPVGEINHGERGRIAVLKNERTRRLFELLQREPGRHQRSLASALGVSPPGIAWHLRRLEQQQLIRRVKEGRTIRVYAEPSTLAAASSPASEPVAEAA